jgi:hypothetical protein
LSNKIDTINQIEKLITDALSSTDFQILKITVEEMLSNTKDEFIATGYKKMLKAFSKNVAYWDSDETPWFISFEYFGRNVLNMTTFQYRLAHYQWVLSEVEKLMSEIAAKFAENKTFICLLNITQKRFENILGDGINFKGKNNNNSYYETNKHEYDFMRQVHVQFVKEDCDLLREIVGEIE